MNLFHLGRRRLGALALALAVAPIPAEACAALTPAGLRQQAREHARFLRGARVVDGRWQQRPVSPPTASDPDTNGAEESRSGFILIFQRGRETRRRLAAHGYDEINCGFPSFPRDGEAGRFFLTLAYDDWRIVHFIPYPTEEAQ